LDEIIQDAEREDEEEKDKISYDHSPAMQHLPSAASTQYKHLTTQ
jgi:hypothetical protein